MKKNLYLIVGAIIVLSSVLLLKKKKNTENKAIIDEQTKIAEQNIKDDFTTAVKTQVQEQAEAMNIDLINEKKAKALLPIYDSLWREVFKFHNITVGNQPKDYVAFKKQIKDLEAIIDNLGYKVIPNTLGKDGSYVIKK
jgi:hypothetical protein